MAVRSNRMEGRRVPKRPVIGICRLGDDLGRCSCNRGRATPHTTFLRPSVQNDNPHAVDSEIITLNYAHTQSLSTRPNA